MEGQCPKCGKDFVQRTRPEGVLERMAGLASLYPFRCQLCTHRFRAFQPGAAVSNQAVDRRQFVRLVTRIPVTVSGEQVQGEGVVTELSMGGCALETETRLTTGTILRLQLLTSEPGHPITVEAGVVRSVRSTLAGLEFLRFNPEEKERLTVLVARLFATRYI